MNKKIKKAIVVIIIIAGALFLGWSFIRSEPKTKPTTIVEKESAPIIEEVKPNEKPPPDLTKLSLPILMYHHIRIYNNDRDTIGVNLSISPTVLAKQLDLIQSKNYTTITFKEIQDNNLPEKPIILTFDDGYKNFYENAFPELNKRGMRATVFVIADSIGKENYMTEAQINEIIASNIEIGSHTLTHPNLTNLDAAELTAQITESKEKLEKTFGQPVLSFAYPGGNYDERVILAVREAKYNFALTTKAGWAAFNQPLELKRERVNSGSDIEPFLK